MKAEAAAAVLVGACSTADATVVAATTSAKLRAMALTVSSLTWLVPVEDVVAADAVEVPLDERPTI